LMSQRISSFLMLPDAHQDNEDTSLIA
jgi:hypothetical protein